MRDGSGCVQEEDWRARESAILALGAISEGCAQGLLPYLADMVGMLLPKLRDPRPLVRSITCWALSRYSRWIVQAAVQPIALAKQQLDAVLEVPHPPLPVLCSAPVASEKRPPATEACCVVCCPGPPCLMLRWRLQGLLARVLDYNKHVQEAACSALATLEEEAGLELLPRLEVWHVMQTLLRVQARNAHTAYAGYKSPWVDDSTRQACWSDDSAGKTDRGV